MPKVSVVIPFYNHGAYLLETLASVTDQSFVDYEIVIVDDGSTDPASQELLATLNQPQCRVIRTPNRGVSAARNCGIRNA